MTHDRATQSLRCRFCEETTEIPRGLLCNQEGFLMFIERARENHAECASFTSVSLAKAHRRYLREMKREMKRLRKRAA